MIYDAEALIYAFQLFLVFFIYQEKNTIEHYLRCSLSFSDIKLHAGPYFVPHTVFSRVVGDVFPNLRGINPTSYLVMFFEIY